MRRFTILLGKAVGVAMLAFCMFMWLLTSLPATGWQALAIPTGSMRPNIMPGSLVLMHRVPVAALRVGDIITYKDPLSARRTITHRIMNAYTIHGSVRGFITKGDANPSPDIPIAGGNIVGKVVWHAPYFGIVVSWARSWIGIAVLVYAPALMIMIEELQRLAAYYRAAMPYYLAGYRRSVEAHSTPMIQAVLVLASLVLCGVMAVWQPAASALLGSNSVSVAHNTLSIVQPAHSCASSSTNTVSVSNNSSQMAASGVASGQGATSGSASNTNNTSTTIIITNSGC